MTKPVLKVKDLAKEPVKMTFLKDIIECWNPVSDVVIGVLAAGKSTSCRLNPAETPQ